ncbi:MAG: class D sortase [Terriglobales bacterium]
MATERWRWERVASNTVAGLRQLGKRLSGVRRYPPLVMIAAGGTLLLYVAAQYTQMYLTQKRLAEQWSRQQAQPAVQNTRGAEVRPLNDGLTRLSIPKINLDAIVVEGTNHRALLLGPGHLANTAEPGAPGNSVLTAHRDTFFRHLHELAKGDLIAIRRNGKTFHYEVSSRKIVKPEDVSVAGPSKDNRLTLITCYPTYFIGPAPGRLVVVSKLVGSPEENAAVAKSETATAPTEHQVREQ